MLRIQLKNSFKALFKPYNFHSKRFWINMNLKKIKLKHWFWGGFDPKRGGQSNFQKWLRSYFERIHKTTYVHQLSCLYYEVKGSALNRPVFHGLQILAKKLRKNKSSKFACYLIYERKFVINVSNSVKYARF